MRTSTWHAIIISFRCVFLVSSYFFSSLSRSWPRIQCLWMWIILLLLLCRLCFDVFSFFFFSFYFSFSSKTKEKIHKITVPTMIPKPSPRRKEWIEKRTKYLAAVQDNMSKAITLNVCTEQIFAIMSDYTAALDLSWFRYSSLSVYLFLHAKYFVPFLYLRKNKIFVNIANLVVLSEHGAPWKKILYQKIYKKEIYGRKFKRQRCGPNMLAK